MMTILIADDHAIVRDGLKQILARTGDLLVGGEARDGHEVVRLVRERDWDLLLMDMSMPGRARCVSRWGRSRSASECCGACGRFIYCGGTCRRPASWPSSASA